jgi:hypothetical protein
MKTPAFFTSSRNRILSLFVLMAVIGLCLGVTLQFIKANPVTNVSDTAGESSSQVQIYYLSNGQVVKLSSSDSKTETLPIETDLTAQGQTYSPFVVAGFSNEKLYYFTVEKTATEQRPEDTYTQLHVYDLNTGKDALLDTAPKGGRLSHLFPSPDRTTIAYLKRAPSPGSANDFTSEEVELVLRETKQGDILETASQKVQFGVMNISRWIAPDKLLYALGWEGESYCLYQVGSPQKFAKSCEEYSYGSNNMSGREIVTWEDETGQYGFIDSYGNDVTSNEVDGVFYRDSPKGTLRFMSNHEILNMLPLEGRFVYLAKTTPARNQWDNYGVDLFQTDREGIQIQRLTQDGQDGMRKDHLMISADGRFVSYDAFYPADVNSKVMRSLNMASSAWVYDTKLGQYYKVADEAMFPVVVWKTQ